MTTYLILGLVLFFASVVQGVLGFGFGMLCMSFSLMLFSMQEAVPLVTGFALLVNAYLAYRLRSRIISSGLRQILLGGLLGVPVGVALLKHTEEGPLLVTLGVVMIVHILWSWRQTDPSALDPGRGWAAFAGAWSGALGASLGTAGPPVVMYGSTKPWDKDEMRGTLQAFFLICCAIQMSLYCVTELMTLELLKYNLALAPVVAVGGTLGLHLSRGLNQKAFRNLVLAGLLILGLSFIRRGLISLGLL